MKPETRRRTIVIGLLGISLIVGLVGGYVIAHKTMPDMARGKGSLSATPERTEEPGGMAGMPGMAHPPSGTPPGAVVLPAVQRQLIGVRSTPVTRARLEQTIRAVGSVDYDERKLTQVNLRVSGWIQKVFVDAVGKAVRKGEPLLTLYSPDLLATQDEYLLALRSQEQLGSSPMPEAKQGAAALVASARERLKLWNLTDEQIAALERRGKAEPSMTVYAPSTGIVLKREALPGKYVEPGTMLYELVDLSTVWVHADIYESEIASVRLNQRATVTFEAYREESFQGKVSYIYSLLTPETRTVKVRIELPNPGFKLKPGMYGTVTLSTDAQERLVVPKEAVLDTGLRQLVYLDRGQGVYMPTEVKVGRRSEDAVEILEGLKEGERVVISANFLLDAESKLASTGNMQQMMGQIGMADWQMRGAREAKMEGMPMGEGGVPAPPGRAGAMKDMEGMKGMPGMSSDAAKPVSETRQAGGLTLQFTTAPEIPKPGENALRIKLTDQSGKPVTNANVLFLYTMPMPGMTESKATATHTKDGIYEGKAMLGMGGTWEVTANVTIPGKPPISEKFRVQVSGGM
jgi:membrane fusion protein, copper/silver efflux system